MLHCTIVESYSVRPQLQVIYVAAQQSKSMIPSLASSGASARAGAHCGLRLAASGLAVTRPQSEFRSAALAQRMTEEPMDPDTFNLSLRKFLKTVGVGSQRETEQAVAKAIAAGTITGTETLAATMTLQLATLRLEVKFDGEIKLL
jgi:hypothetical protein